MLHLIFEISMAKALLSFPSIISWWVGWIPIRSSSITHLYRLVRTYSDSITMLVHERFNHFLLTFIEASDIDRVKSNRQLQFDQALVVLNDYNDVSSIEEISLITILVWVQVTNILSTYIPNPSHLQVDWGYFRLVLDLDERSFYTRTDKIMVKFVLTCQGL